jgi:hypothetical protein
LTFWSTKLLEDLLLSWFEALPACWKVHVGVGEARICNKVLFGCGVVWQNSGSVVGGHKEKTLDAAGEAHSA